MRHSKSVASVSLIVILASNAPGAAAAQAREATANPAAFHLLETTIEDIHAALQSKRLTCRDLVNLYLKRIEAYDQAGPRLNAVQTVNSGAFQEASAWMRPMPRPGQWVSCIAFLFF